MPPQLPGGNISLKLDFSKMNAKTFEKLPLAKKNIIIKYLAMARQTFYNEATIGNVIVIVKTFVISF